jgi:UTP--glucose-1-phosphate uridylyltransferase
MRLVVIPAAGLAVRFLPVSASVPKVMLPLGTQPLIHHALREARRAGFAKAVIVVPPRDTVIRDYFSGPTSHAVGPVLDARRKAVALAAALALEFRTQSEPNGVVGALLACEDLLDDTFGVLLPDDVVRSADHWTVLWQLKHGGARAAVSLRREAPAQFHRFGVVWTRREGDKRRIVALAEKPSGLSSRQYVIFGRYVLTRDALDIARPTGSGDHETDLTLVLTKLVESGHAVYGTRLRAQHYDCGTPEEYARAQARWFRTSRAVAEAMEPGA